MAQRPIDCAVMFVDMRGFTRASEHLGPDGVVALLEGYFELLVGVVGQHSGRACNMAGDGVVVAFGAGPSASETGVRPARCSMRGRSSPRIGKLGKASSPASVSASTMGR